jgi:hypothetical protein
VILLDTLDHVHWEVGASKWSSWSSRNRSIQVYFVMQVAEDTYPSSIGSLDYMSCGIDPKARGNLVVRGRISDMIV